MEKKEKSETEIKFEKIYATECLTNLKKDKSMKWRSERENLRKF